MQRITSRNYEPVAMLFIRIKMKTATYLLHFVFTGLLLFIVTVSCKKSADDGSVPENETLGCSNLLIRNVSYKDTIVEVTLENICKDCKEYRANLGITMLNRQNPSDTLAWDCGDCNTCPKNGETKTYTLHTTLQRMPALTRVLFDFGPLCSDLIYLPK